MSWSRRVAGVDEARAAIAEPGDALDLRAVEELTDDWAALGFAELVPGELVRPVRVELVGVGATRALGARLGASLRAGDLVMLTGPLGAGKTSLTQGIGVALGVRGAVTSPTFVLARTHRGPLPLVHVDAYRLRPAAGEGPRPAVDLDDLDLDDALASSVTVVEWGEGLVEGLSDSRLEVGLERPLGLLGAGGEDGEAARHVAVRAHGPRWASSTTAGHD